MNCRRLIVDSVGTPPYPWGLVLVLIVDCAGRPPFLWGLLLVLMVRGLNVRRLIVSVVLTSFLIWGGLSLLGVDWLIEGTQGTSSAQTRP